MWACAGACSAFVQYFQDHQDQYNAPDDQFRTLANNAPYPSEACCAAAKQFVGQKCSCDGPTLGNAQQARTLGFSAQHQVANLPVTPFHIRFLS